MSSKIIFLAKTALCAVFALTLTHQAFAQTKKPKSTAKKPVPAGPKVTQIDIEGLRSLIKPKGKPLLINFWATWCDPCREEFPDLVKIDGLYKGKVDFITISLDDLADIDTLVPKFLAEVKATMPAYLLRTPDESAAIALVAKDWNGNLPMTALFAPSGETAYLRMGIIKHDTLTAEIDRVLAVKTTEPVSAANNSTILSRQIAFLLPTMESDYTYKKGVDDSEKMIADGQFRIVKYGLTPGSYSSPEFEALKKKYSLTISEGGCMVPTGFPEYARGYNKTMRDGFVKKFGELVAREMGMSSVE